MNHLLLATLLAASPPADAPQWEVATPPDPGVQTPTAGDLPPAPWAQEDPANALYRSARDALSTGDFRRAATLFAEIPERYPRSTYTPDALYWQAFALYRLGGSDNFERALERLEEQGRRFPRARTRRDAEALAVRIRGELAQRGDASAAERVAREAERATRATERATREAERGARTGRRGGDEEDDVRVAALNALLQTDAEQAVPILRRVLARRDEGSVHLRRKAVFLVSQKRTAETEDILIDAARNDPDREVRQQAVFWLSRVPTERAVNLLGEMLRTSDDPKVREQAIFALSQQRSERASQLLRGVAEDRNQPRAAREQAIFWLGRRRSAESATYLRNLFDRLDDAELREKVLFSLSQMRAQGNERWLVEVAADARHPLELRKQAAFWASQAGVALPDLVTLYDRVRDRELREHLLFAMSRRREPAAFDKLAAVARDDADPELRKKAVFWLGQSKDPRAAQLLLELIER